MKAAVNKKHIRNDVILIAVLLAIAFAAWGVITLCRTSGEYAVIVIDGVDNGRYPLDTDIEVTIKTGDEHYNTLVIKNGSASIIAADCPDKLCVKQRKVSKAGETITCLPHRLVIRIDGAESNVDVAP